MEAGSSLGQVIIYGDTLDAYHAMSILDRGAAEMVGFYAPPAGGNSRNALVTVLLECAERVGLDLPRPKTMTLASLKTIEGSSRPQACLEVHALSNTNMIQTLCGFLVLRPRSRKKT